MKCLGSNNLLWSSQVEWNFTKMIRWALSMWLNLTPGTLREYYGLLAMELHWPAQLNLVLHTNTCMNTSHSHMSNQYISDEIIFMNNPLWLWCHRSFSWQNSLCELVFTEPKFELPSTCTLDFQGCLSWPPKRVSFGLLLPKECSFHVNQQCMTAMMTAAIWSKHFFWMAKSLKIHCR